MTGLPVSVPREIVAIKPKHGEPCNRCGLCCIATLCPLAVRVFKRAIGPCPALSYGADHKSVCGLVATPQNFAIKVVAKSGVEAASAAAALLTGSGTGCDARVNGEAPNRAFYDFLRAWDRRNATKVRAAKKLWGI